MQDTGILAESARQLPYQFSVNTSGINLELYRKYLGSPTEVKRHTGLRPSFVFLVSL